MATAPDFLIADITPKNNITRDICKNDFGLEWTPDGQNIVFAGGNYDEVISSQRLMHGDLCIMDRTGKNASLIDAVNSTWIWWPNAFGWLNDETLAFSSYDSGGIHSAHAINIFSGEKVSFSRLYGSYYSTSKDYISFYQNTPLDFIDGNYIHHTVAGVVVRPDAISEPQNVVTNVGPIRNYFWLSVDFGSWFVDWLPETNLMLVLTWGTEPKPDQSSTTNLHLWNVDTGELSILVPNGIDGRFSPDGRFLAHYTNTSDSQLQILELESRETLLAVPSRSPLLISQNNYHFNDALVWSPDSTRIIYRDEIENLAILDVTNGRSTPITVQGGEFLSHPKWSFDGRYLSVHIVNGDTREIAVLQTP